MNHFSFIFYIVFKFITIVGFGISVKIEDLNVPTIVDPEELLTLECRYDMGGEELHSVKWYKEEQEFFRYIPQQQPHTISFPVAGVHLEPNNTPQCSTTSCRVQLSRLTTAHSSGAYKCEVSTEAPKFHVGFSVKNVTVAAQGTEPQLEGLRPVYSLGDLVQANCSVSEADPAPVLTWRLNGAVLDVGRQRTSPPDPRGRVTTWRELRLHAERRHFPLRVSCEAAQPGVPAPARVSTSATARLHDPHTTVAAATRHQQHDVLHWLHNQAADRREWTGLIVLVVLLIFC